MTTVWEQIDNFIDQVNTYYDGMVTENDGSLIKNKLKVVKINKERDDLIAVFTAAKAYFAEMDLVGTDDTAWTDVYA